MPPDHLLVARWHQEASCAPVVESFADTHGPGLGEISLANLLIANS